MTKSRWRKKLILRPLQCTWSKIWFNVIKNIHSFKNLLLDPCSKIILFLIKKNKSHEFVVVYYKYRKVAFSECLWRGNLILMWPWAKSFQNWIVDRSTARNFTVLKYNFRNVLVSLCRSSRLPWTPIINCPRCPSNLKLI